MYLVDCRRCRFRRLIGPQRIRAMRNLAPGVILVELTCYCDEPAIIVAGRAAVATSG